MTQPIKKYARKTVPVTTWLPPEAKQRLLAHLGDVPVAKWARRVLLRALAEEERKRA